VGVDTLLKSLQLGPDGPQPDFKNDQVSSFPQRLSKGSVQARGVPLVMELPMLFKFLN